MGLGCLLCLLWLRFANSKKTYTGVGHPTPLFPLRAVCGDAVEVRPLRTQNQRLDRVERRAPGRTGVECHAARVLHRGRGANARKSGGGGRWRTLRPVFNAHVPETRVRERGAEGLAAARGHTPRHVRKGLIRAVAPIQAAGTRARKLHPHVATGGVVNLRVGASRVRDLAA